MTEEQSVRPSSLRYRPDPSSFLPLSSTMRGWAERILLHFLTSINKPLFNTRAILREDEAVGVGFFFYPLLLFLLLLILLLLLLLLLWWRFECFSRLQSGICPSGFVGRWSKKPALCGPTNKKPRGTSPLTLVLLLKKRKKKNGQ